MPTKLRSTIRTERLLARSLGGLALGAVLSAAAAETAAETGEAPPASTPATQLEGVTVTGERETSYRATDARLGVLGELPLLDTPFSVNVIGSELLRNQQAATYGDYLKNDPSTSFGNVPVGFVNIRGFAAGIDGYLYDGLVGSQGLSDGRNQIEGVDHIEVLKGPSTFLYGLGASGSIGGAINFTPKLPTETPFQAALLNYTSRTVFGAAVDAGDRFGPGRQFGYRLNLGFKNGEQAPRGADWRHIAATLALDWRAAPGLVFTGIYEYADNHFPRLQPFYFLFPGVAVPRAPDGSRSIAQPWDDFRVRSHNGYLRGDWAFAKDWSLTAQALHSEDKRPAVNEARFGFITDADGSIQQLASRDVSTGREDSGQILLHGKVGTFGLSHQLTAGLSLAHYRLTSGSSFIGVFDSNLFAPVAAPQPDSPDLDVATSQKYTASGQLLSDLVTITPQWSALIGGRHARLALSGRPAVSKTSPLGAVIFKPLANASLYASYAEGLEQGGQAGIGTANMNDFLAPVRTRQEEVGGKLELSRISLSLALFELRRPYETNLLLDGPDQPATFVQRGHQRHRGVEFNATGDATAELAIVAGIAYLDPKVNGTGDDTIDGQRPPGVARLTGNLFADYRLVWLPGLYVNAGVYYSSRQYIDGANTQSISPWTRFDIGTRYETRIGNAKAAFLFGVENLADHNYWAGAQSGLLTVADPRTFKATVRSEF